MLMLRAEVVQGFLDRFASPTYLEIGVEAGVTFHALSAARKVAVDPRFVFDVPSPRVTQAVEYHEVPSDDYFGALSAGTQKFEVIYLDGLHTAEQTLRDILNSVEYLADDGVIVIDDVLPTTYSSSLPSVEDVLMIRGHRANEAADEAWMGDIYRLVFFVETFMQGFSYATVKENHGQLVMWRAQRRRVLHPAQTLTQIGSLDYATMFRRLADFRIMPYAEIMEEYATAASGRGGGRVKQTPTQHAQEAASEAPPAAPDALAHEERRAEPAAQPFQDFGEGWIVAATDHCPTSAGQRVQLRYRNGDIVETMTAHFREWRQTNSPSDIIAYRLV